MTGLEHALLGLRHALDVPQRHAAWRRLVRNRMAQVRDALTDGGLREDDSALAAREAALHRERMGLLARLAMLRSQVLESPDVDRVCSDLQRLVTDIERHRRHFNDLVYDSVSMELGGSE